MNILTLGKSLLLTLSLSLAGLAQASAPALPAAPQLAAKSYVLMDAASGKVLVENNGDQRLPPASLTKLMTAYIATLEIRNGKIGEQDMVTVSEKAWRTGGSRMFIQVNTQVSVSDLLHGIIIQSGNDASVAIAEYIAGSEEAFAALMNREAQRLGMVNTNFTNSTGLPHPQLYPSANDLARLAAAIVRDFPEYYSLYSLKEFTYNNIKQPNRNRLLYMDPTVDGMKTGHTSTAGYCLVSTAERGPRRLVAVVLGAASDTVRAQESLKLLNFGFQFYDTVKLYKAEEALSQFRVWKGKVNELPVGFTTDFVMSLPKESADKIQVTLESRQPLVAPIEKGQEVGVLSLRIDGEQIGQYPVLALQDVPVAGFFGRLWDAIVMLFKRL